jgi:hypothetical protein
MVGDGGARREADDRGIPRRRGAIDGERGAGRAAGERGSDRPAGVGEFVLSAEPQREVELALVRQPDAAGELRAEHRAQRVGGLLCNVEVERIGAGLGEGILRCGRELQPAEGRHRLRVASGAR